MVATRSKSLAHWDDDSSNPGGLERLLDLIGAIYDASLETSVWPRILASLAPFFEASRGALITLDPKHPALAAIYATGFDSVPTPEIRARNKALDYWCQQAKALPTRSLFLGSELVPFQKRRKSGIYRRFVKSFGLDCMVGGVISNLPRHRAIIAFFRAEPDFDARNKRLMSLILPHVQLALFVNHRLGEFVDGHRAALELLEHRSNHGILMLNAMGEVLHANQRAIALCKRGEGISLKDKRVIFRSEAVRSEFDRLVQNAARTALEAGLEGGGFLVVPRRGGKSPIEVAVSPVRDNAAAQGVPATTVCMAFIHDPADQYEVSGEWLRSVYGLTPAEVRLCQALFHRASLSDAARRLCVTDNTVRSQLKGVFAKLGVASQSQLMLRLAMGLIMRMAPPEKSTPTRRRKMA